MGVAHEINVLSALLHLVKMVNNVVTFFGSDAIEVSHVDNESLVSLIVVYTLQASPYVIGCGALINMNHLGISEVILYLHAGECIIGASILPALGIGISTRAFCGTGDVFQHAISLECCSHFCLPDDPIVFIKVSS